jgi:TPR repeat protein
MAAPRPSQSTALPCSLQLFAAGELAFRSRLFAATLHNASVAPSLQLTCPVRTARRYKFSNAKSLAPYERLKLLGCGLLGMLLLRMADVCIFQSRDSTRISAKSRRLMRFDGALHRVAAVRGFATPEGLVAVLKAVRPLLDDLRFAAAAAEYRHAVAAGHVRCRAELAWLLLWGRDGVPEDKQLAFRLAFEGVRLGCEHSCGVLASCFAWGAGCVKDSSRAMQLASKSAAAGSRYGQYAMGRLHFDEQDDSRAAGLFRQAAAQRLDAAQWCLGFLHQHGKGVNQNVNEALHWYRLAADQGLPLAYVSVAQMHERGEGVQADRASAVRLYRLALAAGHFDALAAIRRLT